MVAAEAGLILPTAPRVVILFNTQFQSSPLISVASLATSHSCGAGTPLARCLPISATPCPSPPHLPRFQPCRAPCFFLEYNAKQGAVDQHPQHAVLGLAAPLLRCPAVAHPRRHSAASTQWSGLLDCTPPGRHRQRATRLRHRHRRTVWFRKREGGGSMYGTAATRYKGGGREGGGGKRDLGVKGGSGAGGMCGGEAHRHNTRKGETRRLIGGWWVAVVCVGGGGVWWCVVVVVVVVVVLGYQRCARPAKNLNSTPTPRADRAWCGWPLAGEAEGYDCVARAQQPSYRGGRAGGGGTRGGGGTGHPWRTT